MPRHRSPIEVTAQVLADLDERTVTLVSYAQDSVQQIDKLGQDLEGTQTPDARPDTASEAAGRND